MAKVLAIRYITLRPGVAPADFELLMIENGPRLPTMTGVNWSIIKGDLGDRAGCFTLLYDFESVELRNYYCPANGVLSWEMQAYYGSFSDFIGEWDKYASSAGDLINFTDYPVIGEF